MKKSNKVLLGALVVALVSTVVVVRVHHQTCLNGGCSIPQMNEGTMGAGMTLVDQQNVPDFSALNLRGNIVATVVPGAESQVSLTSSDTSSVKTFSQNHTLTIKNDLSNPVTVQITTNTLDDLALAGHVTFKAAGLHSDHFSLSMAGNNDATIEGVFKKAQVQVAGQEAIHLSGSANSVAFDTAGTTMLDAKNFAADNIEINSAGQLSGDVNAVKNLNIASFGSVNLHYQGNPVISKTGMGAIVLELGQ